jgi:formate hydrogenlyase subunit 4
MNILPGTLLADLLGTPEGVAFETWASFIDITAVILIFVVVIFFILFSSKIKALRPIILSHRLVRLKKTQDVFRLNQPWTYGLWFVLLSQLFLGVFLGLIHLPKNSSAIAGALAVVIIEGLIGMLLYWLISMFPTLPKRIKYTPFAKYSIYSIIGRRR